jgi:hypothetical protein
MKAFIKFYAKHSYHLRSHRLLGRRRKSKFFSYSVSCCQVLSLSLVTQPPQTEANLRIEILVDKGKHSRCKFHSFTDMMLYNRPHPITESKRFTEIDVSSPTGSFLLTLSLHKPFACPCKTFVKFSVLRTHRIVHTSTRVFRIES